MLHTFFLLKLDNKHLKILNFQKVNLVVTLANLKNRKIANFFYQFHQTYNFKNIDIKKNNGNIFLLLLEIDIKFKLVRKH